MTTLFDVRMYRAKPITTDPRGEYVATTKIDPRQGLTDWPDYEAVKDALPYQWRKAFARNAKWWANKHDASAPLRCDILLANGFKVATLHATRRDV